MTCDLPTCDLPTCDLPAKVRTPDADLCWPHFFEDPCTSGELIGPEAELEVVS